MNHRVIIPATALLFFASPFFAQHIAPDASVPGPLATGSGEYALGAAVDPLVLPGCVPTGSYDCNVEVRAHVDYPATLTGTYPLLVFLHGNHGTCGRPYMSPPDPPGFPGSPRIDNNSQYTGTGTCPAGYIESPSYLGYEYMATRLASYGYIVVSIDANRGITAGPGQPGDAGLNKARGHLVLRNLQNLSTWNQSGGTPGGVGVELKGHLDFTNVGLLGHSRGGEGVRAAYNFYIQSGSIWPGMIPDPITFKGVFEIAPVDGQTDTVFNSKGIAWTVIAGMCDGDVSNLQGIKPYDRDILPPFESPQLHKASYIIWGANHNFFNTQWQVSDASQTSPPFTSNCAGLNNNPMFTISPGSPMQRLTSMSSVLAFFRANVGPAADSRFNQNFNPPFGIPPMVSDDGGTPQLYPTRTDRGYTPPAPFVVFEDFTGPTGTSSYGFPNDASNITINHGSVPNHDASLRAGQISWTTADPTTFFQSNWVAAGQAGMDITSFKTLEIRVSRQNNALNPPGPTDFTVNLVAATNVPNSFVSPGVHLANYTDPSFVGQAGNQSTLTGPVGGLAGGLHPILQTVRIPLTAFGNVFPSFGRNLRGVRLTFDQTGSGAIYVANIRFSTDALPGTAPQIESALQPPVQFQAPSAAAPIVHSGNITSIRSQAAAPQLNGQPGIEISVTSPDEFPVKNSILVMRIGSRNFDLSRYDGGVLTRVTFTLTNSDFAALSNGDPVVVQYGYEPSSETWNLGPLNKNALNR